jgi:phospholipid transport system transporter-binding protein
VFAASASLTHETARAALDAGLARIAAGDTAVDCALLVQFDSSALAVLLAWRRAAEARGAALEVVNLPPKLDSLAHAYGIAALIQPAAQPAAN